MAQSGLLDVGNVKDQVSEDEWKVRCDLAACYRLVAMNGWDDLVYTHISARVPGSDHHFLLNPMGLLFEEVTASNLVKIDLEGNKVLESPYEVNAAGFIIHSAIHEAREDAGCVLHLHTDYGVAVSMLKDGLLPHSQTSSLPYMFTSYHDYEGIAVREGEKQRLVEDLGSNFVMILRNHGTLTVGRTVGEAFIIMYFVEKACRIQILAQSTGQDITPISEEIYGDAMEAANVVNASFNEQFGPWQALLRKLNRTDTSYLD